MNFENPVWLYLTPLIVLVIAGLIAFGLRRRDALLRQFAAARLLDQLTEKADLQQVLIKAAFVLLACALIGVALARPQYGVDFIERKARGLDIVFVLDSSRSMLATDLRPTRLERARLAIIDLVERLESDRIGLVVFSGNAFLQTPPTLDYSAFRENLNSVSPSSISRGGSNIGQALREAVKAFPKDDNFKIVVLLTDGEDLGEQAVDTAREIASDGIKVYSIGIGTQEGTYLKVRSENGTDEFIRDSGGQPVRSRLDEQTLRKISQLTGGSYSRLAGQSIETLYTSVLATLPREERESELQETRIERYQWVLLAAVICLILETLIRRRKRVSAHSIALLLALLLMIPTPSSANETDETDQALPDQPVEEVTDEKLTKDPRVIYNQAHANLVEGNYAKANELFEKAIRNTDDISLERNGLYNMAHAMNQMGEEALQAQDFETAVDYFRQSEALFKSANELDPTDSDSMADAQQMSDRRKALEDFIEQQESQEQQESKEQQKSDSNDNQDSQESQDSETDSGKEEQEENKSSSENTSSESDDSKSGKSPSEQEQSESQEEDTSAQQSTDTENDENSQSDQSEPDSESSEDTDSEETDSGSSTASDEDPNEDIQQQDETAGTDEENEAASETENGEAIQEATSETDSSEGTQQGTLMSEDVRLSDAQILLDSLRKDEKLLPFTESSETQGANREIRDW